MPISYCNTCGKKFTYFKSNSIGKYCSKVCVFNSTEWREKQSKSKTGKKFSELARSNMSKARKGVKKPDGFGMKISIANKGRKNTWSCGEKSRWWKGGITNEYRDIRKSTDYKRWRRYILKRDNYRCVKCGNSGNTVDHIIPFASILEESKVLNNKSVIFDTSNGRTLCVNCHKKTPTYNRFKDNQVESILLSSIKYNWEQLGKPNNDFELFYRMKMEKIIESVKSKLD